MAQVRCDDASMLGVHPVPVRDRDGVPYELTLRLTRDGREFGGVGERCGYFLAAAAARLRAARAVGPDDAFPASSIEAGLRSWASDAGEVGDEVWATLLPYLPRDRELFCFRSRDPDDLTEDGGLRVGLQVERSWLGSPQGRWESRCMALLEAWGAGGTGVRTLLTSEQLLAFLEELVREFAEAGVSYAPEEDAAALRRPVG